MEKGVLIESVGGEEIHTLHKITSGNQGRISPLALREPLVLPMGVQPEETNLKGGRELNHVSHRKWSLKPEKENWCGNDG